MLSLHQIQRMVQTDAFGRLVERVLANGRELGPAARRRLRLPGAAAPAGLGLALQRTCELTYAPGDLGLYLAHRLLRLQRPDGLFGGGGTAPWQHRLPPPIPSTLAGLPPRPGPAGDPAAHAGRGGPPGGAPASIVVPASAAALRGLVQWRDQCGGAGRRVDARVARGIRRAAAGLACALAAPPIAGSEIDPVAALIVLGQIGEVEEFRRAVPEDARGRLAALAMLVSSPAPRRGAAAGARGVRGRQRGRKRGPERPRGASAV